MKRHDKIEGLLDRLILEAEGIIKPAQTSISGMCDRDRVRAWSNELILFTDMAGDMVKPWRARLTHNGLALITSSIEEPLAALKTIKYALGEGLLSKYRDLVLAESLDDLFQQGDHLLGAGYALAAGVIFRAVLEEKLRSLCRSHGCSPQKSKPTLNDFNTDLYRAGVINKSKMQMIQGLGTIGNNAAHNLPEFQPNDVKLLRDGTFDILANQ